MPCNLSGNRILNIPSTSRGRASGWVLAGACMSLVLGSCTPDPDKGEPSPPLSPEAALESFALADPQLHMELVAAEPLVQDPVAITFDAAGRLWVVEMLGFMQDIDGSGEEDPVGRVSVLFDDDGDGRMDRRTVFLDSLVMPRAVGLVDGGVLVAENIPLWFAEDLDGDFVADRKTLVDSTYGGSGMPEHSANGLWRGMDNWIYNAKSSYRYRRVAGEWIKDETEFRGQWGIAHDNAGRLVYNYNWSQLHADLVPPNSLDDNPNHTPGSGIDHGLTLDRTIFPIRSNTAVNRGYVPGTLDPDGRLLEFASACGPLIYRGDALPESYRGDAFICEPTANLIKQNDILEHGFMLEARAVYPDREFLASTDERFRPISLAPGPDGALYVVDMYKGIIQHGPYMTDYLREVTLERKLDQPIHMGRIWRITRKQRADSQAATQTPPHVVKLEKMSPEALVDQLDSPDGWTRDTAQRLLVAWGRAADNPEVGEGLKQSVGGLSGGDPANTGRHDAVLAALRTMTRKGSPFGQLHALWTLQGMGWSNPEVYLEALQSDHPIAVQAALRILEPVCREDRDIREAVASFVQTEFTGAAPLVQMQMVLAADALPAEVALPATRKFLEAYGELPVARDVAMSSLHGREMEMFERLLAAAEKYADASHSREGVAGIAEAEGTESKNKSVQGIETGGIDTQGTEIFAEMLVTAMANSRDTRNIRQLLALARDTPEAWQRNAIVQGMLNAPEPDSLPTIDLPKKPPLFEAADTDPLVAALQDRFTWPGKPEIPSVPAGTSFEIDPEQMTLGRQQYLNLCANCHGTKGEGIRRFAPPLKDSEWVNGEDYKLAMILLHGMEGPVEVGGKTYGIPDILPSMPSFSTLQDRDIAAIATYIRNAWGHSNESLSRGRVTGIRFRTQGKIKPWTAGELDTLKFSLSN